MASVQFGCGLDAPADWINFDSSPTLRMERTPILSALKPRLFPKNVRYGDIVRGLPLPDQTADRLYASHVLEHLPRDDVPRALRNCYAVLKPGGLFRLIVPDLYNSAKQYLVEADRKDPEACTRFMDDSLLVERRRPTLRQALVLAFGGSPHRWIWDEFSLGDELRAAGFINVRRCVMGDSRDPEFGDVESADRFGSGDLASLAIECQRP